MSDLAAIKRKLALLTERTVERGFTEAEALSAAEMIQDILDEHGLTMADIESQRQAGFKLFAAPYDIDRKLPHEVKWVSAAVGDFFDVEVGDAPLPNGNRGTVFFGFEADVIAALTLYDFIRKAMDTAWGLHRVGPIATAEKARGIHTNTMRHTFMVGMAERISERLREIKDKRRAEASRALVVLKDKTIQDAMSSAGLTETGKQVTNYRPGLPSYADGRKRGDEVPLTPQVDETKKLASG